MKEKVCAGCKESWPNDEEFYKPNALKCLACQFEIRRAHKARRKERIAALPAAEREKIRAAENERARKRDQNRYWGKKTKAA